MEKLSLLLSSFQSILAPQLTQSEISRILLSFQDQMNIELISQFSFDEAVAPFKTIWQVFIEILESPTISVRLAAARALGTCLIKFIPYYPEQLTSSFSQTIKEKDFNQVSAAPLIATFCFLIHFLSPPLLEQFIKETPIYNEFDPTDNAFSEHISGMISSINNLPKEWFEGLLRHFLEHYPENPSRQVIRTMGAIVAHSPSDFYEILLSHFDSCLQKHLTLFSYIFSHVNEKLRVHIPLVQAALNAISSENAQINEIDSSLQILSKTPEILVEIVDEHTCLFKLPPDTEAKVDLARVNERPLLYSFFLPLEFLKPKKNDTIMILCSKFKNIAEHIDSYDNMEDVVDIFVDAFSKSYTEMGSAALQGVSNCINKVFTHPKFIRIMRKIFFCQKTSWFHSYDTLLIIKKLHFAQLSDSFLLEILDLLIEFTFNKNVKLYKESIETIAAMTNESNMEIITKRIANKVNFYDAFHFQRTLNILTEICAKFDQPTLDHIEWFVSCVIEMFDYYQNNIIVMNQLFLFISKINRKPSESMIKTAYILTIASYELITGLKWPASPFPISEVSYYRQLLNSELWLKNVDIIAEHVTDCATLLRPLYCSINLLFKTDQDLDLVCKKIFRMFPYEISKYLDDNWDDLDSDQREEIVNWLGPVLPLTGDKRSYPVWCSMALKAENPPKELNDFLTPIAEGLLKEEYNVFIAAFIEKHGGQKIDPPPKEEKIVEEEDKYEFNIDIAKVDPLTGINYSIIVGNKEQTKKIIKETKPDPLFFEMTYTDDITELLNQWFIDSDYQIDTIDAFKLNYESWKPFIRSVISKNSVQFITSMANQPKLTKNDLKKFLQIIPRIEFSDYKMLNFSSLQIFEAKSMKRMRIVLAIYANVIHRVKSFEDVVMLQFCQTMNEKYEFIPFLEVSHCLRVLCHKLLPPPEVFGLIARCLRDCPLHSHAYVHFDQILVHFGREMFEMNNVISWSLNSQIPSFALKAYRVILKAIPHLGEVKFVKDSVEPALAIGRKFPFLLQLTLKVFTNMIISRKYTSSTMNILDGLYKYPRVDSSMAHYSASIAWFPLAIQVCLPTSEVLHSVLHRYRNLFEYVRNRELFEIAINCLKERMLKVQGIVERDQLLMDAILTWASSLEDSHNTTCYLSLFFRLITVRDGDVQLLSFICVQMIKSVPRFSTIFYCLAAVYKTNKEAEWMKPLLYTCSMVAPLEIHQGAIKLLAAGRVKEALKLSFYDVETDEAIEYYKSLEIENIIE